MDRILSGRGGTLPITVYDSNGAPADAGGGNGTAAVTDSAGVAVAGSPFTAVHGGTGVYTVTIPATLQVLDSYTVNWTFPDASTAETPFEIVGGFYFTIAELRATDPVLAAYSADNCRAVRSAVEDRFEQRTEVAFVPRGQRQVVNGDGTYSIIITPRNYQGSPLRSVVAVTVDGVALSAPDIAVLKVTPYGLIQRPSGIWNVATTSNPWNISILYEHGESEPPAPVKAAALRYARHLAVPHAFDDDRMISFQTDVGIVQQSVARAGKLGFPDIDSVLDAYASVNSLVR